MARPKGAKNVKKKIFQDPMIEEIVEEWVEMKDPKTGKMIRQLVKIKKLKKVTSYGPKEFHGITSIIDDLEQEENERLMNTEPDQEE